jgi:hypothetical protein
LNPADQQLCILTLPDFAIGGWIGQTHTVDGVEALAVTYWSRKLALAERKYPVHLKGAFGP